MKTFEVSIPITGVVHMTVECESADEDAVFMACMEQWDEDGCTADDIEEWEFVPHVTTGNVTNAVLNDIDITEVQ